jgi:phosphoribosylformylglycinamidine synthase
VLVLSVCAFVVNIAVSLALFVRREEISVQRIVGASDGFILAPLLVEGAASGLIRSAHDCAEGGVAITAAESCFDTGLGASIDIAAVDAAGGWSDVASLFAESASRVVVSVRPQQLSELLALAAKAGVPAATIGTVGGDRLRMSIAGRVVIDEPMAEAERIWSTAVGSHFEKQRVIA